MDLDVVTIFPRYFDVLDLSLARQGPARRPARRRRARPARLHERPPPDGRRHPLRRRARDAHEAGAVGRGVWTTCAAREPRADPLLLIPTPAGVPFSHEMASSLADEPWLVLACGRYEGIDARVGEDAASRFRVREVSLGDYVLNGGEVAALAIIEAVGRLLPGVVGNDDSLD